MRLLLIVLLILAVLAGVGWWLIPLLLVNGSGLLGVMGALLLALALVLPSRKPKCQGHHCSGCTDHR